jgi:Uma2 family endonuclease
MSANPRPRLTADEYLALDRSAEWKSEFHDGEMFPIEAVSLRHATIATNVVRSLGAKVRAAGCTMLTGPLRVRISPTQFVYPDYQIVCGKAQLTDENEDTVTNPKIVIEILSPSTANYDHGEKFDLYRRLSSIEEYVLIAQAERKVEVFSKQSESLWSLTITAGSDQSVRLKSVDIEFSMIDLYEGVEI